MFSKKEPTHPMKLIFQESFQVNLEVQMFKKVILTKKKEKNVNEHSSVSPEGPRNPFLQKRKEKNVINILKKNQLIQPKFTFQGRSEGNLKNPKRPFLQKER